MEKTYTNLKQTEKKKGEVEYEAEIAEAYLGERTSYVLEHVARDFELPGFRKGKVPINVVREHVGEMDLFEDAAEDALRGAIKEIMKDEELSIIGSPQLTVTKYAPKNPVAFKVRFAIFPEVSLPDYKAIGEKIAKRKDETEVSEAEMKEATERIQKMLAEQAGEMPTEAEEEAEDEGKGKKAAKKKEAPLPELTDEFVQKIGPFKNVEGFKTELKRQLQQEKEMSAREIKRDEIVHAVVKDTKIEIPELLIDQELGAFAEERDAELLKAGITMEDYLKQTGKTEKVLEKEERALIENQVKTNLVFREIRDKENVTADEKAVQTSIAYLKLRYPDRDEASLRSTAEAAIIQEKIFDLLSGVPKEDLEIKETKAEKKKISKEALDEALTEEAAAEIEGETIEEEPEETAE
jgi:trigger factor